MLDEWAMPTDGQEAFARAPCLTGQQLGPMQGIFPWVKTEGCPLLVKTSSWNTRGYCWLMVGGMSMRMVGQYRLWCVGFPLGKGGGVPADDQNPSEADDRVVLADEWRSINGDGWVVPTVAWRELVRDGRATLTGGTRSP